MVGRIGSHIFYSWKGATGSAAAFSQAYSGLESLKPAVIQAVAVAEAEAALSEANPALGEPVKGIEALEDPRNADLLNYRSAGADHNATRPDETEVVRAIESAL
jgi:hypothetical protein